MIKSFRILGNLESTSFLLLLLVAMPLKYIYGEPQYVRAVGSLHGALFVLYVLMALLIHQKVKWTKKDLLQVFILACVPLGPTLVNNRFLSK
jgi:integral membrane protein